MFQVRFHGRGGQGVVTVGLNESTALFEARRCMSCGICAAECPCGAIAMVPEP